MKGYYLQQVRDEKALPAWLYQTFKRFLLEENEILRKMQESLADYRMDLATSLNCKTIDLTLMHVAFAIAWFNQHETGEDKYLFFRSAYKHFKGFYSWPDSDLDDDDVAGILDIKPGTLRTRTSRLCAKVKGLVYRLSDADIATLNKQSLDIAKEIYETPDPDIESILERLLEDTERELDQYEDILALRKSKRMSKEPFKNVCSESQTSVFGSIINGFGSKVESVIEKCESEFCKKSTKLEAREFEEEIQYEDCMIEIEDENIQNSTEQSNRIVRIFQELIDYDDI